MDKVSLIRIDSLNSTKKKWQGEEMKFLMVKFFTNESL
jgi:hypothetical protein